LAAHVVELTIQYADALRDPPAIDFEFGFTGTARPDAAAEPREVGADADEIRLPVAQLREFHLQFAFAAARVPGEDVEDQHRAVDDRQRHDLFQILSLPGAQVVEHEQQIRACVFGDIGNLSRFAAADQRCGIDALASLHDALHDIRAGRVRQRFELGQFRFDRAFGIVRVDCYDDSARLRYVVSGRKCSMSQDSPSL
jgi:hypothetical protein